ncbi:probable G-protein coupled receptor 156 [Nerophis lumbriciformis]|uniref:probable G-protein coupled receptor 156 n=1 Tax=Nerophis lumbriciformis TaxID=546530 RepID=UPI002ADFC36B|nr:probable G-protein coupled receptor 156 [Nerophis lumbriciformis]XP_061827353.1 probable G-protein coupled receptor 156 [Nerophis lumbriciformis]
MEAEWNCSFQCESPLCLIHSEVNRQESMEVMYRLCTLSKMTADPLRRSLSPVLSAVVWTLLSCGIVLAFCFLLFTLRFKNNRIVKMSSPNLNVLSLFGSILTYSSGFLFATDGRSHPQMEASTAVLHAQVWTLCLGSTMVFGPILGKTWRLYRVFTQRMPDKRVIIRDIQLMAMVALLLLMDLLVLTAWNLTDPIRCSQSVTAVVKLLEKDISYSLSQLHSCSSVYSHLWVIIIAVKKGCLLLYGTYLAGLTSNVSHPPVNQSPTILTAVTLVALCSTVAIPVSVFMQAWPNLVYSTVGGAIFICTLATNCMLFVPQLAEWRNFEEDQNNPGQMAKYFSSPSKSQPSVYSQDEIYFLLGENNSMKKLLNEKNAVIDSLQEQVNNAKDKLLRLVSASQGDVDSTNLPSSSTQTTELQSCNLPASPPQRDNKSRLSHVSVLPCFIDADRPGYSELVPPSSSITPPAAHSPVLGGLDVDSCKSTAEDAGLLRTAEETAHFVTSVQSHRLLNPCEVETLSNCPTSPLGPSTRPTGFVSSEKLQEILQELNVETVLSRRPSHIKFIQDSSLSPISFQTPRSPNPTLVFHYPSISPYAMRKRRPPFHSPRRAVAPACLYTKTASCRRTRYKCGAQNQSKHPEGVILNGGVTMGSTLRVPLEVQVQDKESLASRPDIDACDINMGSDARQHCEDRMNPCHHWDSDSSSSTDYSFYHRPYCDSCLQRGSLLSSDSSSDSSDSEYEGYSLYRAAHPVVFKEDLEPTLV